MKKIAILGSTGSIGRQTLEVVKHLGAQVVALSAGRRVDLLISQIKEFKPDLVSVTGEDDAKKIRALNLGVKVVSGMQGACEVASHSDAEIIVSAIVGFSGIKPTLDAIALGKTIALANKEVLVAAGDLVMSNAKKSGSQIIPVDSEHSAIFQCLEGKSKEELDRLILTASGGAFFTWNLQELSKITPELAICHPNWSMGPKITVDSSTMMNKGLEVIEAAYLFGKSGDKIDVVIHPQSVIHSMVEMVDGSMFAQMSQPDMRLPIQYALTFPKRTSRLLQPFSFAKHSRLEFFIPEKGRFPCLDLAYICLKEGGSFPCFLNAANEILVERFLNKELSWLEISQKLEKLLSSHQNEKESSLEAILAVDALARNEALTI